MTINLIKISLKNKLFFLALTKFGKNAWTNAPSPKSRLNKFGNLNATKKISLQTLAPRLAAIIKSLIKPKILEVKIPELFVKKCLSIYLRNQKSNYTHKILTRPKSNLAKIRFFERTHIKRLAVGFSGVSGSGKTTLILKIANKLILQGFKVCVIKHDPGDKAKFDIEGKDSARYFQIGASVAVISPKKTALFLNDGFFGGISRINSAPHLEKNEKFENDANLANLSADLDEIIAKFGKFDYLLVEGLKYLPLPKLVIFRDKFDENYLPFANAVVSNLQICSDLPKFGLEDIDEIINWINKNAKKV